MTSRAQELLREALGLPVDERAGVAAELLASLDDVSAENPAEVEAAWAAEIEKRVAELDAGTVESIPWEQVRQRLLDRLNAR